MSPHEPLAPDGKWGAAEASRRRTFREKLEWLQEAETLTLRSRAARLERVPEKPRA